MSEPNECPCGKPIEHLDADPDSQEWVCRMPEQPTGPSQAEIDDITASFMAAVDLAERCPSWCAEPVGAHPGDDPEDLMGRGVRLHRREVFVDRELGVGVEVDALEPKAGGPFIEVGIGVEVPDQVSPELARRIAVALNSAADLLDTAAVRDGEPI